MKPINIRTTTWADLQKRVTGLRLQTLLSLQKHGPCTTRNLAAACSADVLSIRPRVTELIQLGLVQPVPAATHRREGVYRALSVAEAESLFAKRRVVAPSSRRYEPVRRSRRMAQPSPSL